MNRYKTCFLLLAPFLSPPIAWAQSARYDNVALGTRGPTAAIIAVCGQPANTTTQPCSPLATLGTSLGTTTGGANPFSTDAVGNYHFYAPPGTYTIQIYGPQISQFVMTDVSVGGGSVSSVGLTAPSWLTVTGSPITLAGTLGLSPATGQTSHQVLGTCGTATSFAPCALVGGDIPATNLAATGNGGVTGTLPGASVAVFGASGASHAPGAVPDPGASAGTTRFLREDATFAVPPAGGVSEMVLTTGWTGLGGGGAACNITTPALPASCVVTVFPNAHTLVRFTYSLVTSPAGCTTSMVIGVRDMTTPANLTTVTLTNGLAVGFKDSGALSVAVTAGHAIAVGSITPPSGCSTPPEITGLSGVFQ